MGVRQSADAGIVIDTAASRPMDCAKTDIESQQTAETVGRAKTNSMSYATPVRRCGGGSGT